MTYDLVIRGAMIVDGSGMASYAADVGIKGDRIAKIGRITTAGEIELDAHGQVVTPGFIDGHTHFDAQINWDPLGTSSCWQGVTTVVMGNCGYTLAPCRRGHEDLVVRNLERAEDIPAEAMALGIKWSWETFPEYLDVVDKLPKGINYAVYVGHSALRTWAMGQRAFEQQASEDDLVMMEQQLREGLKAGAIGFSTSRNAMHLTAANLPVASRLASWEEVRRLVMAMGELGTGVFELSLGPEARSLDAARRNSSFEAMRSLAIDSGVPLTFGLTTQASDGAAAWQGMLDLLDATSNAGGRMFGQSHSRDIAILLSFRTQLPFDRLQEWQHVRSRPLEEQRQIFSDPVMRQRLVHAAHHGDYGHVTGADALKPDWDLMYVYSTPLPPYQSVAEMSRERGVDPVDLIIDLALQSDFHQFFIQHYRKIDDEGSLRILRHPRTVMTFSDTGAHVGQISDCSIHTHLLAYWVRQRKAISLEEGVRMITFAPARAWGFSDRGLLREGLVADLNVFDPNTITPCMPTIVSDLPGGATRLIQRSEGIKATIVAGKVLFRDGVHTGALPGRLLRRSP